MSLRGKNGHNSLRRKTPVIYVLAVIFLTILFFSNDFGLVDIQKTAIVLAVGIDRENEESGAGFDSGGNARRYRGRGDSGN